MRMGRQDIRIPNQHKYIQPKPKQTSLLDVMVDGREFESLVSLKEINVNILEELRRALRDISIIRQRPTIGYIANVVNTSIKAVRSIDYSDDLPFSELVNTVPEGAKDIDVIIVTPGGSGSQVAKFVDKLRSRFDNVSFIIPDMAMSAGTILALSGDEIIMTDSACIGPIDPQVQNKEGVFVPAQSLLTLINQIQEKGELALKRGLNPEWTDLQILRQIDPKEIGNAISASNYSVELVENYLFNYKFRTWISHRNNGAQVTPEEKKTRANKIANQLCDHSLWKSHGRGITRESAHSICNLYITHSESIEGLDRSIKRLWALCYWIFENTPIFKMFVSDNYSIMRNDRSLLNQNNK